MVSFVDVYRLAVAVASEGTRVWYLGPYNRVVGVSDSLINACVTERPFFVSVNEEIVALDSDLPEDAAILTEIADLCEARGCAGVLIASGQARRRHFFVRADPALRDEIEAIIKGTKIDPRQTIRPPLSPHRLGLAVELLEPLEVETAIRRLGGHPLPRIWRPLSPRMYALLRHGDRDSHYRGKSEVLQALALAAVNSGWTFEEFMTELMDPANVGGERTREKAKNESPKRAKDDAKRAWLKAITKATENPAIRDRGDAYMRIAEIRDAAVTSPWPGKAGATQQAVVLALCDIAESVGSLEISASDRQIAEKVAVGRAAASRALKTVSGDWVDRVVVGKGSQGSTWRLRQDRANQDHYLSHGGSVRTSGPDSNDLANHDCFRWGGLGKNAGRIFITLLGGDKLTTTELSRELGLSMSTIRTNLKRLEIHGLAQPLESREWACSDRALAAIKQGRSSIVKILDEVAAKIGTYGAASRAKERFRAERERYKSRSLRQASS